MPNNQYKNKIIYGGQVLIDLTHDDVTREDVANGVQFHLPTGEITTGTNTFDADTRDATAGAAEILDTKTAYVNGQKVTGTMPNVGEQVSTISSMSDPVLIQRGFHDGSGRVGIATEEQAKLIADNIREGVTILGVLGTMSGAEDIKSTAATITPYTTSYTLQPSDLGEYNSITEINVNAIAYNETDNEFGGITVTIGTVAPTP